MLKKCLKYDLKYVLNYWIISTAIFIIVSVIGAISLRLEHLNYDDASWFTIPGIMIFIIGSFVYTYFSAGVSVYRCHKSCFTDEGYLTFTLPVKRQTLLLSKVLSIIISFLASVLVLAIAYHGVFAIVPALSPNGELMGISELMKFYNSLGESIRSIFATSGAWAVVYIIEVILLVAVFIFGLATSIFNYMSKHIERKKHPKRTVLKFILIYLLFTPAITLFVFGVFWMVSFTEALDIAGTLTGSEPYITTSLWLLIALSLITILTSLDYHSSLRRISDKLNLE